MTARYLTAPNGIARFPLGGRVPFAATPLPMVAPVTITVAPGQHAVTVPNGQDAIIQLPKTGPLGDANVPVGGDAQLTITGGRYLQVIGGQITPPPLAIAKVLTDTVAPTATSWAVDSAAGFPPAGLARWQGELFSYTGIDAAGQFQGVTRNAGPYNGNPAWGVGGNHYSTAKSPTSVILPGEYARSGLSFIGVPGNQPLGIWLQGIRITSPGPAGGLVDAVRVACPFAAVTLLDSVLGPVGPYDAVYASDGHGDGVQLIAAQSLTVERSTIYFGDGAHGVLIKGSDGGYPVKTVSLKDSELIDTGSVASGSASVFNADGAVISAINTFEVMRAGSTLPTMAVGADGIFTTTTLDVYGPGRFANAAAGLTYTP